MYNMIKCSHTVTLDSDCEILINLYLAQLQGKAKVNTITDYNAVVKLFEYYKNKIEFGDGFNRYMIFKVPGNNNAKCGQYATFAEFSIADGVDGAYVRFTRERVNKNNNGMITRHSKWL